MIEVEWSEAVLLAFVSCNGWLGSRSRPPPSPAIWVAVLVKDREDSCPFPDDREVHTKREYAQNRTADIRRDDREYSRCIGDLPQ